MLVHNHACSFTVVCGCFPLQGQSGVVALETLWPQSPKHLLSDLLREQYADPCSRVELSDASHPGASWKMMTLAQWTVMGGRCPAGPGLGEQCLASPKVLVQRLARGLNPAWGCSLGTLSWPALPQLPERTSRLRSSRPSPSLLTLTGAGKLFMVYKRFSLLRLYFCLSSQA